ncbi:MAG: TonB-dependent receptor [Planctomycetes bacterium]|nr:TonB-dependent receptor [Planctomycetota bacterium]
MLLLALALWLSQETESIPSPHSFDVIQREDIDRRAPRTLPEALEDTRGVLIRRTALAEETAVIRGFTGPRTLLLIDGIRLNNGTTRDDSTWNTLDLHAVDRFEILRGPSLVAYGADAVGGVVLADAREPSKFPEALEVRMRSFYRYSSAENSHIGREEMAALSSDGALYAGVTYRDFGDLTAAPPLGRLPHTAYDEIQADAKLVLNLGDDRVFVFGMQGARHEDLPTLHRTIFSQPWQDTAPGTDLRHERALERDLIYLQFRARDMNALVDDLHVSVSYHRQFDELDRIDATSTRSQRQTEVRSGGFFLHAARATSVGQWRFGGEFIADVVNSRGSDISAGGITTPFDRGEVADDSVYDLAGLYVQDELALGADFELTLGARAVWTRIHAIEIDPSGAGTPPFQSLETGWAGIAGNARVLYRATDAVSVFVGLAQGHRAPNLDDTTGLHEFGSGQMDFPNRRIDPELPLTVELGMRSTTETFRAELLGFLTRVDDFIDRRPEPAFGPDAFVRDNVGDALVHGVEAFAEYRLCTTWTFWTDFTWSIGEVDDRPLSKMNPATGHLGVRYAPRGTTYFLEGVVTAVRRQRRLSPVDELDVERIPPGGTPGYLTATLRGGLELLTNVRATAAVENITNADSRAHGSGINAPGTNFVLGLDVAF